MRTTVLAGQKLKLLRNQRKMTVRNVEQASRRIAEAKGDKRFCISNSWLAQLENGSSSIPDSSKLFSLGAIYRVGLWELLRLFGVDVNEQRKYEAIANPELTLLLPEDGLFGSQFPSDLQHDITCPETRLLSNTGKRESHLAYGRIGSADRTLYPLIRPNSIVEIDTTQDKLETTPWSNEFDRPVYFIELRDSWACGWCELEDNELRIVSHPSSGVNTRQFPYEQEAEIVGRVVGYYTQCVNLEPARNAKQGPTTVSTRSNTNRLKFAFLLGILSQACDFVSGLG